MQFSLTGVSLRRQFPIIGLALSWALTAFVSAATVPMRPNVVLVLADQWRAEAFGFAGNPNVQTPHLDRLAREGLRFNNAIAQTRDAQQYLRDRTRSAKPFFLFLAWGPPHDPYQTAPAKYRARYDPGKLYLRPNVPREVASKARNDLAGYYAHCTALDDCLGGLRATLQETGLEPNTLLVFTSDHGDLLGAHGGSNKQQPYDESIRIPLLWRWPEGLGVEPRAFDALVGSEDFMPTILGLCGVAIPATVEGLDFSGYLRGGANPSDGIAQISCVAPFGQWARRVGGKEYRGIRTSRFTYVRDLNGPWLLFDNRNDPWQLTNLVNQSDHARLQIELEAALKEKLRAARDDFLPADRYLQKWGYAVDATGTVPYTP